MEYEKLESLFKILLLTGGVAAVVLHLIRFLPLSIQALRNSRAGIENRSAKVLYKNPKPDYFFQGRVGSSVYYVTFRTDLGEAVTLYLKSPGLLFTGRGAGRHAHMAGHPVLVF